MRKHKKMICILGMVLLMTCLLSTAAFAAGDVASAVEKPGKMPQARSKPWWTMWYFPRWT